MKILDDIINPRSPFGYIVRPNCLNCTRSYLCLNYKHPFSGKPHTVMKSLVGMCETEFSSSKRDCDLYQEVWTGLSKEANKDCYHNYRAYLCCPHTNRDGSVIDLPIYCEQFEWNSRVLLLCVSCNHDVRLNPKTGLFSCEFCMREWPYSDVVNYDKTG